MEDFDAKKSGIVNGIMDKVWNSIERFSMLKPEESVLAAVSGGADSVAMIHFLSRFSERTRWRLAVAHFNHCLRGAESDRDSRFVRSLAESLGLSCFQGKADVEAFAKRSGLSLEEAARNLRYAFLRETAQIRGFDKIALGHNKNDSAETVMINLLRGSGPRGLSGIPPVRDDIVRPLIEIEREEIERFLSNEKIGFVFDSSNSDTRFVRNRVRNILIPLLEKDYNPEIVDALNRAALIVRDEQDWLDNMLEDIYNKVKTIREDPSVALSVRELKKLHVAAARLVVRKAFAEAKGDLRRIAQMHVETVVRLANENDELRKMDFPGPVRVERRGEFLVFVRRKSSSRPAKEDRSRGGFEYEVARPGTAVSIKETGTAIRITETDPPALDGSGKLEIPMENPRCAYIDADSVAFPVKIRSFRPGDRFTPLGLCGVRKLKKFFIDNKVPLLDKGRVPILESRGKIFWVAGYRIDESHKISESTRRALKLELLGP